MNHKKIIIAPALFFHHLWDWGSKIVTELGLVCFARTYFGSDITVYAVHFNVKGESAMIHEEGEDGIEGELGL